MADQIQPKAAEVLDRLLTAFHIAGYPDWREFASEQEVDRWDEQEMAETHAVWDTARQATATFDRLVGLLVGEHVDPVEYREEFGEFLDETLAARR
jgi:hypothetical protein